MINNLIRIIGIVVIIFIIYLSLYFKGVFYLKKIYIDNIEINITDNMHLMSVDIEGINTQDIFSALLFKKQIDKYEFPKYKRISFLFASIDPDISRDTMIINLDPWIKNEIRFKEFTFKNFHKKEYQKIESKKCLIFATMDDVSSAFIFYRKKEIMIEISSNNEKLLYSNLLLFCTDAANLSF